jgi:CBS domain-containing protein
MACMGSGNLPAESPCYNTVFFLIQSININQENMMSDTRESVREMTVSTVMQHEVLAVEAGWSPDQLADFLVDNSISGAPVTAEDGELVGVVSLTDIVRQARLQDHNPGREDTHDFYLYELDRRMDRDELRELHIQYETPVQVRDIMTPMIFSVGEDTSVQEVADTMLRGRIHRVFVTRDSKLTGIVTTLDMLQVIRDI